MTALIRILSLWRGRSFILSMGLLLSLVALACAVALMSLAGATLVSIAIVSVWIRVLGPARVVVRYFERLVTHDGTFKALADLRVWFFRGLARNAAGGLGFRRAGDALSRLVGDVEALDGLYLRILVPLAGATLAVPAAGLLAGRQSAAVGWTVFLLFAVAAFGLPLLTARAAAGSGKILAEAQAGLRVAALDALTGLREVRAFGAESRMSALVAARETVLIAAQRRIARGTAWANFAAFLCGQAAVLAVLSVTGVSPVLQVASVFLTVAAYEAIAGLPRAGVGAGYAAAAAARVLEIADAPASLPDPSQPKRATNQPGLRFEAVGFAWGPGLPPVFDGLTFDIPAGACVAVLGPSGIGKSTLAALALKVAAPQAGRVLLGGVDIAEMAAADVRGNIAWLGQTTHLFDDSIRNNLLLGRPGTSEAELWEALDRAAIGETVRALPDGIDSWLGEGGARFSGGQGRRVALARTLLSRAPVLILDEPCAGLDAETERAFFRTLYAQVAGRTVILIAHRLTGAERLDRIWRLSAGHAVAAAA